MADGQHAGGGNPPVGRTATIRDDEIEALMDSTAEYHKSVARIIIEHAAEGGSKGTKASRKKKMKDNTGAYDTNSSFLVNVRQDGSGAFLSCNHCVEVQREEHAYIRVSEEKEKHKLEVYYRDLDSDAMMFLVKDLSKYNLQPLRFFSGAVAEGTPVAILGYSCPEIGPCEFVLVEKPSVFPSIIKCSSYGTPPDYFYTKVITGCPATPGVSGSPLMSLGRVIGMHVASDGTDREAISVSTLKSVFRRWLKLGSEDEEELTIEQLVERLAAEIGQHDCCVTGTAKEESEEEEEIEGETEEEEETDDEFYQ